VGVVAMEILWSTIIIHSTMVADHRHHFPEKHLDRLSFVFDGHDNVTRPSISTIFDWTMNAMRQHG
jgi:hypothetical protein